MNPKKLKEMTYGHDIGDWVILYGHNMSMLGMGQILSLNGEGALKLSRPTRYTLGSEGFSKGEAELTFTTDITAIQVIVDSSREDILSYLDVIPAVEYLGKVVRVNTVSDYDPIGVIKRVYPNSLILNPFMEFPDEILGIKEARTTYSDYFLEKSSYTTIIPIDNSLEELVRNYNRAYKKQKEEEKSSV